MQEKKIQKNILEICEYGITEMVNNVLDHSQSKDFSILVSIYGITLEFTISDNGIGIFKNIQNFFKINDIRQALLELFKGKFTTDPANHTGEGIFFTSRIFDRFSILSGKSAFICETEGKGQWLLDSEFERDMQGTVINMEISLLSPKKIQTLFDKFFSGPEDYSFSKTHIPISLIQYEGENLVSRSQAKRILTRTESFREIILDFNGVKTIGQAFADQIFRVFKNKHSDITIIPINTSKQIKNMIQRVTTGK